MAEVLYASKSDYYKLRTRKPCKHNRDDQYLLAMILKFYNASNRVFGSKKIKKELDKIIKLLVNHKSVERTMYDNHIYAKVSRQFKVTTNSKHRLLTAENLLNRDFTAESPNMKMVSDITYVKTDEGWLYVASIIDLCGRKVVGSAMDKRMTKELICSALDNAYRRIGKVNGCLLQSDRGSQYCSFKYQKLLKDYVFICSMSRKGNCWDNAPMESFWGKLKEEGLNEQHFHTRNEAKAAILEYIWIFYGRKRIHETNNYLTPEEY
jgi:putative transposase